MKNYEYCFIEWVNREKDVFADRENIYFSSGEKKNIGGKSLSVILNFLGKEGWEMVGCGSIFSGNTHTVYFKREL